MIHVTKNYNYVQMSETMNKKIQMDMRHDAFP